MALARGAAARAGRLFGRARRLSDEVSDGYRHRFDSKIDRLPAAGP